MPEQGVAGIAAPTRSGPAADFPDGMNLARFDGLNDRILGHFETTTDNRLCAARGVVLWLIIDVHSSNGRVQKGGPQSAGTRLGRDFQSVRRI